MPNKAEKRKAWNTIRRQAADVADFIEDIHAVFGRADFTQVEIDGVTVVDTFPRRSSEISSNSWESGFVPQVLADKKAKTGEARY